MRGDIAAARALLSAGNFKSARAHAEKALQHNERDPTALTVYCDVLAKENDLQRLEQVAVGWVEADPQSLNACLNLLLCYVARKDKAMAEKLVAHFRRAAPHDPEQIEALDSLFQAHFGDAGQGLRKLAEQAKQHGDKSMEFWFSSLAAAKASNLREAIKEAEYARRAGDERPETAALLAMLYYRTFRFAKCRHYARIALKGNRDLPKPRELLVLSWLVLFPPFFFAHLGTETLVFLGKGGKRLALIPFILMLLPTFFALLAGILALLHIPVWMGSILFVAYAMYQPYIGAVAKWLAGRKPKEVKLEGY